MYYKITDLQDTESKRILTGWQTKKRLNTARLLAGLRQHTCNYNAGELQHPLNCIFLLLDNAAARRELAEFFEDVTNDPCDQECWDNCIDDAGEPDDICDNQCSCS